MLFHMRCYFDESGDFAFSSDRLDCYTQAAVVCPDSFLPELADYIEERKRCWSLDELHATEMDRGQRLHVCHFIASSPLELVVQVTDTALMNATAISSWRRRQAIQLQNSLSTYHRQGGSAPDVERRMKAMAKRSGLATRVSDVEFVQAVFLIDLTFAALQKSVVWFAGNDWCEDFGSYRFIYDGKLPAKLGAGEKLLCEMIVPVLGSNARFALEIVDVWKGQSPPHPFIERFERRGGWSVGRRFEGSGFDLNCIFEHGLSFEDSRDHPGLQIADTVGYVARQAVLDPEDEMAELAYESIRAKLSYQRRAMTVVSLEATASDVPVERYRRLLAT
jgi:hypothetical protein